MNPNIQPLAEYLRRHEAAEQTCAYFGIPIFFDDAAWNITDWLRAVQNRDTPPERCTYCVTSRMEATFTKAKEMGFTHFFSSLLYSKYQPHEAIRKAGERLSGQDGGPIFMYRDFRPYWQAGIDLSISMGIYRQPYCGCVYSETDRYHKAGPSREGAAAGRRSPQAVTSLYSQNAESRLRYRAAFCVYRLLPSQKQSDSRRTQASSCNSYTFLH